MQSLDFDVKQQNLRFKHLVNLIEIKKNDKILDIGCGLGDLSHYLKKNKINCNIKVFNFISKR
jgi:cyclopropane fatty-acyl-phospholipid synthase-like methyltransferase